MSVCNHNVHNTSVHVDGHSVGHRGKGCVPKPVKMNVVASEVNRKTARYNEIIEKFAFHNDLQ